MSFSLFFCLDTKEPKGQGCIFFAKIVRLVSEGAETRFAQTAAPSFRYKPPNFFTQKKEAGPSGRSASPSLGWGCGICSLCFARLRHRWGGGFAFAAVALLGLSLRDGSFLARLRL